jgi:hypothetical protein
MHAGISYMAQQHLQLVVDLAELFNVGINDGHVPLHGQHSLCRMELLKLMIFQRTKNKGHLAQLLFASSKHQMQLSFLPLHDSLQLPAKELGSFCCIWDIGVEEHLETAPATAKVLDEGLGTIICEDVLDFLGFEGAFLMCSTWCQLRC